MKIFNIVMAVLFVLFAALQYNDPDPLLWIAIYLFAAFLCLRALRMHFDKFLYLAGYVLLGIYAIYLLTDKTGVLNWATDHNAENIAQTMKAEKPWIEETREFFGLIIILIVMIINHNYFIRKKHFYKKQEKSFS